MDVTHLAAVHRPNCPKDILHYLQKKKDILLVSKVYRDMLPRYGQDPELCELFILHLWPPWEKKRKIYQFKVYRSVPLIIWSFLIKLLGHVLSCIIVHGIP